MGANIKLSKSKDGLLVFDGTFRASKSTYDSIVVKGKTYTNHSVEELVYDISSLRKSPDYRFYILEYDFKELNKTVKIEECSSFSSGFSQMALFGYSRENVAAVVFAFESGLLPKEVCDVYTQRGFSYYSKWSEMVRTKTVHFFLFHYWGGYSMYYKMKIEDVFKIPVDKLPKDLIDFFSRKNISLKSKNKKYNIDKFLKSTH
jgi:hypothetical protein